MILLDQTQTGVTFTSCQVKTNQLDKKQKKIYLPIVKCQTNLYKIWIVS